MWSEALSMIDRADRLHRQFSTQVMGAWEPPVDVVECGDEVQVYVALPGVRADSITIGVDSGGITVSALRRFPCRSDDVHINRIEIPYGRFERRLVLPLADPYGPLQLAEKTLTDGVLALKFRRKEIE
jgi:HSP20 family molecular chaperone IbpA